MTKPVNSQSPLGASEYQRDALLIRDFSTWGCFPVMPLKRARPTAGLPDTAFLLADNVLRLYEGNYLEAALDGKPLSFFPCRDYPSVEAILDDGWVVD